MKLYRFDRTASDCENCPLNGRPKVKSACGIPNPSIVIIGEAPGAEESHGEERLSWEDDRAFAQKEKGPFIGPAGGILKQAVSQAGIMWHTVYRMNVINCRPTNNEINTEEAREAIRCCRPGFEQELARLKEVKATVLVPVGNTALEALGVDGTISRSRGSVYSIERFGGIAVPTYHPSFILRGAIREQAVWVADLRKARELSLKRWKPPVENFNLYPKVSDVEKFVKEAIEKKALVACDIETDGGFSPDYNSITMIGLAMNGTDVLVVPFKRGGEFARNEYWSTSDYLKVTKLLKKLFVSVPMMFQNAMFDVYQLAEKGFQIKTIQHDTMLLHHAIHPELPHDLAYIVSIYGETPNWKEVVKGSKARMIEQDEETIRLYNARDTAVLHQVLPAMLEDLKDVGTEKTYYEWSMKLVWPLIRMKQNGVLIDQKKIEALKRRLTKEYEEYESSLRKEFSLPPTFNLDSTVHIGWLLHSKKPASLAKKLAEKDDIDKSEKRSKTTKKYQALKDEVEIYQKVKPLYKTKTPKLNADGEALVSIQQHATGRLDVIEYLKRPKAEHDLEKKAIHKLLRFIELYSKYGDAQKMLSTYTKYPVGKDGRVHPDALIHGTATGRLSMRNPNLQNQPKHVRSVFVSEAGNVLIEADYSNLELRVLAYVTEEPFLVDAFEKGMKIHKVNCKLFWGIEEDDPTWEKKYRVTKSVIFGSNYGGGLQGLYTRAMADVPGMDLSFARFSEVVTNYFAKMTKYSGWQKSVRETVTGRSKKEESWGGMRWIANAFGRKRFFLGTLDEIEREALNTPIQGTAADIAGKALITLDELFQKKPDLKAKIVCMVHDSILVECPKSSEKEVAKLMKSAMEQNFVINGKVRKFPVDLKVGTNWYEMIEKDED